jgi:NDP-mannose synthase
MRAVIFAGGRGTRLAPFTQVLPKPLVPIGDRSIIELIVGQLTAHGFKQVTLCVGYLGHLVQAVLEGRGDVGAELSYVYEDTPLGTAAPLKLVPDLDGTFLAMNGDILTSIDYGDIATVHKRNANVFTVATHVRRTKFDYGVLELESEEDMHRIVGFEEKPEFRLTVSMGVYMLEPRALEFIPEGQAFDIPDLVRALLDAGEPVGAYPYEGFWLDLGRHEDYEAAVSWERDRHLLIREGLLK